MTFWIVAIAMALAVAALVSRAVLHGPPGANEASGVDIYRDQLAEVERDRARGLIDAAEAERIRIEVSRRLLDADRQRTSAATGPASRERARMGALASGLGVLVLGVGIYLWIGTPGYDDMPIERRIALAEEARENRIDQATAERRSAAVSLPMQNDPRHEDLVQRLRDALAERPDDLEGLTLLVRNEAGLGNFVAAREAQARILELKGADTSASDWSHYALLLTYAAGGYVSPEAEAAVAEALRRDPSDGAARYIAGLLYADTGRPDHAFRIWRALLEESAPSAPWYPPIQAQIEALAQAAGVDYSPPAPPRGPTADDMAAAEEMAPEDRQAMISGMVEGLAARLAETGGPAEDWARLITALGVLGERDRAGAIYAEAREAFGAEPRDLALIEDAAERAGIAE
jgi:cytochrome c-type biogenesis protein CcmH